MRIRIFILLLLIGTGYSFSKAPPLSEIGPIGVRTLSYVDESRSRPVTVELWYPAEESSTLEEFDDSVWIHPKEMRNALLQKRESAYPLILMSHGHRGDRRDRSWLAEYLVRRGYIVASVEHFGNTRGHYDLLVSLRFWERPRDVAFALDQVLREPFLKEKIDADRIGFVGYSLGGMTGLSLAGAKAKNVKERFLKQHETMKELNPKWLEALDLRDAEKSYADPRIQAFLLICPAIFVFPSDSLKQIQAPIGLIASLHDEVLPHREHAYQIIKHLVPFKLKMMRNQISHYSFLNRLSEKGKAALQGHHPFGSEAAHREAASFAISFFEEVFKKRKG